MQQLFYENIVIRPLHREAICKSKFVCSLTYKSCSGKVRWSDLKTKNPTTLSDDGVSHEQDLTSCKTLTNKVGGSVGTRTRNQFVKSELLYRLSYDP